jgi:hypothetical protein
MRIDCMSNLDKIELRRVQALQGERSFTLVFPKDFAVQLGIGKGDFLKCQVNGNRLIIEKVIHDVQLYRRRKKN